jgi:hypothetical protein
MFIDEETINLKKQKKFKKIDVINKDIRIGISTKRPSITGWLKVLNSFF